MRTHFVYTANEGRSVFLVDYSDSQRIFRLTKYAGGKGGVRVAFSPDIKEVLNSIPHDRVLCFHFDPTND